MRTLGAALCFIVLATVAHAACVLRLTTAEGRVVTVVASQVVGVLDCPTCGSRTGTLVNTLGPTYSVRESPEEVSRRLEAALKEGCNPEKR